jgi:hypothetical protein
MLMLFGALQIRAVNTWKGAWGEDAEEYVYSVTFYTTGNLDPSHLFVCQIQSLSLAQPPTHVQLPILLPLLPRRTTCMYRKDDGDRRDESCLGARSPAPLFRWALMLLII